MTIPRVGCRGPNIATIPFFSDNTQDDTVQSGVRPRPAVPTRGRQGASSGSSALGSRRVRVDIRDMLHAQEIMKTQYNDKHRAVEWGGGIGCGFACTSASLQSSPTSGGQVQGGGMCQAARLLSGVAASGAYLLRLPHGVLEEVCR